jgi:lipoprotein NlpI
MKSWPAPLVQFYLGQLTPEALLTAANSGDAATRVNQTCDANFYIGEYHLWQGQKDDARRVFTLAAKDDCQGDFLALEGAKAELKALDAKS